jgi:nucleoside-diphosphate-sugar epimerase
VIRKHVPDFYFVAAEIGEDPDKRNYLVSNKRTEETGFRTTVGLDDGIGELVRGYQILRRDQHSNIR